MENFDSYSMILSQHAVSDAVYQIQYSCQIDGIATHDLINIYIQENGEVGAYMMPNRNMFKDITIDSEKLYSIPNESELLNEYITINSEGVVLVRNLNTVNDKGQLKSIQKTYLIGK